MDKGMAKNNQEGNLAKAKLSYQGHFHKTRLYLFRIVCYTPAQNTNVLTAKHGIGLGDKTYVDTIVVRSVTSGPPGSAGAAAHSSENSTRLATTSSEFSQHTARRKEIGPARHSDTASTA